MRKASEEEDNPYDSSKLADQYRDRCRKDLKYFYLNVLDIQKRGLGRVHDFLLDFIRLDTLNTEEVKYSSLYDVLPERDATGEFKERWIHWPTLATQPVIQDGPTGPVSEMFHTRFWRGMVVRVVGDGRNKCTLLPRGHLKSTLATGAHTLWEIIRDPTLRHVVLCATGSLATSFVRGMKFHFEQNQAFRALFGNLGPPKQREALWNEDRFQVSCRGRRGTEPTVTAMGMDSAIAGFHFDRIRLDDPVIEQNSTTADLRQKVCTAIQRMEFVRDPGSTFSDIGTIWADDDAHGMFIRPDGPGYGHTSFIVATIRDEEEKALWPEVFTEKEIQIRKASCKNNDFIWFTQYYNQPIASGMNLFRAEWIKEYDGVPEAVARDKRLNLVMAVDPAMSKDKHSDFTGCVVLGQSPDGTEIYLLDGIRDKLSPDQLPKALGDLALKWSDISAVSHTSFRLGVEANSFQTFVASGLRDYLRSIGRTVFVEELKHGGIKKEDRIKVLVPFYSTGRVYWPRMLWKDKADSGAYNFISILKEEFTRYSAKMQSGHDDILDAHAYAESMLHPTDYMKTPESMKPKAARDSDSREESLKIYEEERATLAAGGGRYFPPDEDHRSLPFSDMRGRNSRHSLFLSP